MTSDFIAVLARSAACFDRCFLFYETNRFAEYKKFFFSNKFKKIVSFTVEATSGLNIIFFNRPHVKLSPKLHYKYFSSSRFFNDTYFTVVTFISSSCDVPNDLSKKKTALGNQIKSTSTLKVLLSQSYNIVKWFIPRDSGDAWKIG